MAKHYTFHGIGDESFARLASLVPGAGLEPARPEELKILSLVCLPFHHPGDGAGKVPASAGHGKPASRAIPNLRSKSRQGAIQAVEGRRVEELPPHQVFPVHDRHAGFGDYRVPMLAQD